jgi:hypothetical protein
MAGPIDNIPAETRWQIATKGLTGACMAAMNALRGALSQEKFDQFQKGLWSEAGKGSKDLADTLGLKAESPKDIDEIMQLAGITSMGPEFKFETVEASEDKSVGRSTQCPWHERWKEMGLNEEFCTSGHQGWGEGAVESLNPKFTFSLTKNMTRGDPYCEWVVERKK